MTKTAKMWIGKGIAVCLGIVLLCGMIPLGALAAGYEITALTQLVVTIDEPCAGREASFDARVGASPVNGARAFVEQRKYSNYYHGVMWWDHTESRALSEGEMFVLGHEYTAKVYVIVNNPGYYRFSSGVSATVNAQTAVVSERAELTCFVSYHFSACEEAPEDIRSLALGGLLYPVAGEHPVFEMALDEERVMEQPYPGTAFINGVAWVDADTWMILDENDVFLAGHSYTLTVMLRAKGNYRFATADGESAVSATINGFETKNITYQVGYPDRNLKLERTFACADADSVKGGAPNIYLTIAYPVAGKAASHTPTLLGENTMLTELDKPSSYWFNGVRWYDRTSQVYLSDPASFVCGEAYSVSVLVSTDDIIHEDAWMSYIDHGDGTYTPYVRAYVNGLPARVEPYDDVSIAQTVKVVFDFPACEYQTKTIEDIQIKDIDPLVVGQAPDTEATLLYRTVESGPDIEQTVTLEWYQVSYSDEPTKMSEEDVCLVGCHYFFALNVTAGPLASFLAGEVGNSYDGTFSARGSVYREAFPYEGRRVTQYLTLAAMYMPLQSLPAPIDSIDVIGAVAPVVGQRACLTAALTEESMQVAEITNVEWFENGAPMMPETTFQEGNSYFVYYTVSTAYPYSFQTDVAATVNGEDDLYTGAGDTGIDVWTYENDLIVGVFYGTLSASSSADVTEYVEVSEVMLPAPGQYPDFNASIDSAYTQFGGITWCELDDDGYVIDTLHVDDVFKRDTTYRLELRVLPTAGRTINVDSRGAYLNGEAASYYYLSGEAVTIYAEYDTSCCIDTVDVYDIQYPIGGKTPDEDMLDGDSRFQLKSALQWQYETNPDAAVDSFADLTDKLKYDRRHRVYAELQAADRYWFATDKDGNLAVDVSIDGETADFYYATDANLTDGVCHSLEAAYTFELASMQDGVFIDGILMQDGDYLENYTWKPTTEQPESGYAYYEDGVLYLSDFERDAYGDYDGINVYQPLTIDITGDNYLGSSAFGLTTADVQLQGEADSLLKVLSNSSGLLAYGDVTVQSGNWRFEDSGYSGIWVMNLADEALTVNGGELYACGPSYGIESEDIMPIVVNGGKLLAQGDSAIYYEELTAPGAKIMVGDDFDGMNYWDSQTRFIEYRAVSIEAPSAVLLGDYNGDGTVNMIDSFLLYSTVSKGPVPADKIAVSDMNGDGTVNMIDSFLLYKIASGT